MISFRFYVYLTILIALILGYEYLTLNQVTDYPSIFEWLKTIIPSMKDFNTSTEPGRPISYWLGVGGFGVMCITNLYIMRKRWGLFAKWGKSAGWLNFHIFCGMLGPVLIVFHSNFKVQGLVAISFWSMVICATSGIVGRYFYIQTLTKRANLKQNAANFEKNFPSFVAKTVNLKLDNEDYDHIYYKTKAYAGVSVNSDAYNILTSFMFMLWGDFKMMIFLPKGHSAFNKKIRKALKGYGKLYQRITYFDKTNKLLGYWHSFHLPFAIFMYLVAVIHIVAALLFGVNR